MLALVSVVSFELELTNVCLIVSFDGADATECIRAASENAIAVSRSNEKERHFVYDHVFNQGQTKACFFISVLNSL